MYEKLKESHKKFYYGVIPDSNFLVNHEGKLLKTSKKWTSKQSAPWFLKIKVLKSQGLFQTLEKFQVLQTWIFFQGLEKKGQHHKIRKYND